MWLAIGIGLPIAWFVIVSVCDMNRDAVSDWSSYWLLMFTYAMPWVALFAGVMHILSA